LKREKKDARCKSEWKLREKAEKTGMLDWFVVMMRKEKLELY
jgi:hypothetical protein